MLTLLLVSTILSGNQSDNQTDEPGRDDTDRDEHLRSEERRVDKKGQKHFERTRRVPSVHQK